MKKFLNSNYGYVIVGLALFYFAGAFLIELYYRKKENELQNELIRLQKEEQEIKLKLENYK